jgi:hypothetical protein
LGVIPQEMQISVSQEVAQKRLAKRKIRCLNCGEEREDLSKPCPNCGVETVNCAVCKLPISYGSTTAECPKCNALAHKEHLFEWVKVKGSCPVCQRELRTDDLIFSDDEKES